MLWVILLVLFVGAIGGVINALLGDDRGIMLPKTVPVGEMKVFRPGVLGNIGVSAFAAFISWALYGPLANYNIVGKNGQEIFLSLATLGGAGLIGFGGARWLTNEVDKKVLKEAVSQALQKGRQGGTVENQEALEFGTVSDTKPLVPMMSRQEVQNATPMKILDMLKE